MQTTTQISILQAREFCQIFLFFFGNNMKIYILLAIVAVAFLQLQALPIGDVSNGCVAGVCNNVNADWPQNRGSR